MWFTLICNPSEIVTIPSDTTVTFPPVPFKSVDIPKLFMYLNVFPTPVKYSPWTWSIINSFAPEIVDTDNLKFLPKFWDPMVVIPRTSPTEYPVPPLEIVAAIATPFEIVIFALASLPFPVMLSTDTLENTYVPEDGVYPIPAFIIPSVLNADPAEPT